ncbi:obscurin-like protein 1 isoform X7 [Lacerta agilis]|uniref:obscurin-like protein 1 isoform X7 n=1 Tax=Lacerta agilis TaxID=80427 RepID=UPI0014194500|nr:obscurin-like protein 1 isoform X7 [Lacerta agilis]
MPGGRQAGPLTAPYEVPGLSCIPSVSTMDAFGGAPRFLTYPRTFTVPSGTNAVLKWQVAGEPRPSVAWEKDGSVLDLPSGRMLVEADGDAYSLLVYQAGPADSGRYVCKAKNSVGETYAAATLKVETAELRPKGELDAQPPVFLNRPVSARVTRGEDVSFACRVSGELEWEKDGWKLSDIFESSHYKVGRESGDWHSLQIYNTRLPDAGVYVCRAQNSFGETMAAAVLLVDSVACDPHRDAFTHQNNNFKKQLEAQDEKWRWHHPGQKVLSESRQNGEVLPSPPTPKAFTVNEGKHAKFRCYVTGKPKPEIVWQKDGMVLSPGRRHLLYEDREGYFILKVLYCTARDCGLYVCTACNTAGQTLSAVSLHVKEPRLRFQAPLVDVEVLERQDAVLECQVPLETIPTAWYLEDKRLQPSPKYLMEEQGLLRRLTVRDARADDDGIYLCEMEGKGRSVGELSVQGLIVKRLPRKLDVMEGENAAFYVETREPVEAPSWGRNGQELVEAPHTLIRSFGKTHLLVLVHVTRQDAGVITFTAGESQTSAQLRVKCAKRIPPSAPVAARMCISRNNAALLTWCPPPDVHRSPPSSYILERQAVGEAEWVPCLTTDVASMVEVPGDGVPQEADYRFRVCSANQYGCSGHVEFPGTVHLVPRARIQKGLQDVRVHAGEDATFSVQLSASQSGCWFFNGKRLEEEEGEEGQQYQITHSGLDHALRIKGVQLAANGSEVQFEANGVKECAALCVQAPQVHITPVPEARRLRTLTAGMPLLLECEVSIPDTPINWFKEGNPVALDDSRFGVQTEGRIHRLLISSVCSLDSGTYTCDAGDDAISFTVTVDEPPVRVVHSNAEEAHTYQVTERVVLTCELSHPDAPVRWYKDGEAVKENESFLLESEGPHHRLVIPAAQVKDAGEFVCDISGDSVLFNVTVTDPPVRILHSSAEETHAYQISERVVLACQLSRPDAPVRWYKDGEEVEESEHLLLESEGPHHRLVITSAQIHDTGEFVCDAGGDSAFFNITITEPPVHVVHSNAEEDHTYQILECVTLSCELSRPDAPVLWYKNGEEVEESEGLRLESEGSHHRLVIASACVQDTGEFVCDAGGDSVFFSITVTEPPVRALRSNAEEAHTYKVAEHVVLDCELSRPDASVCWYKDGEEVEESDCLLLESDGPHRRLVIPSVQMKDAGEFVCDAGSDSVFFNITVTEPPVQILHPVERSLEKHIQAFECLELSCKVSIPNAPVRWFKDGLEVDETNNLLLQMEGAERRLVVLQASAEDAGEYICETKDESVSFDVRVSEPPVKIVQPRRTPSVLKASTGETVTLTCVLSHENAPVRWVKDGVTLEANSGLILEEEGARRCLVIPAAGPEHSGKYTCNAVDDTMAFAVQVSDPPVRIVGRDELQTQHRCLTSEDLTLSVTLSCPKGEVKWYKDGEKLQDTDRVRLEQDGACHSLVILGAERCDAGEYLCDSGDDSLIFYVTVEEPPISIVGNTGVPEHHSLVSGEALILACKVSSPSAAVRWLRNGEELVPSKRVRIEAHGRQRQLTILGAKPGDSGSYVCDAGTDRMESTVKVAAPPVHIVNKNDAHVPLEVQEGENMTLVARLSQEKASVQWLKNMRPLYPGPRLVVSSEGAVRSLTIRQAEPGDSGTYTCDTGDDEVHFTTCVQEAPVLFVPKPEHPEKVLVLEGGSAVLSAIVSKEPAMVRWEGPRGALVAGDQCQLRREGRVHSLLLSNVGKADAGEYICHSHHDQLHFELSVKELPVKFVRGLSDVLALQGETVLFWCELCKTKGDVLWLKDGQELEANEHKEIRAEGRERSLTLRHVGPEDAGEYSCESKDDRTLAILTVQIPRSVEIISELHNLTVLEGDDATFKVVVSPDDVALKWQHHGQDIVPSERFTTTRVGLCHTLTIQQCRLSDTGIVTVHAEGLVSSARLSVQEAQVIFVQTLRDLMAEEGQDVCLEVELSLESAEVQWMKQGILLQQNTKYSMEACGSQRTLTIHNIELADRGTYRCESLHDRTQARLSVEPRRVMVRKPLLDVETFEKETVTFELELSHANVAGVWTRDGIRVKPSSTCRVSATGFVHSLTLLGLTLDDSGTVAFTADTVRSSARLTVQEPPVTMLRFPQDMGIPDTGSATFECELSRPLAEVKWYKDGEEIQTGQNCRMYSVGRRRLLQLSHCGLEDAGEYTCDAGDCRASAKLRVFERQVQIVRELEDVRVRENENAVFMCEVSLEEVKGEWFRDGERIKVSSIVKIRQEGTRHFLLLCCVRPEDSGQVRFVAKAAASEARLEVEALPIRIVKPLRDKTVLARHKATLECTVSQSRGRVRWFRGDTEIFAGDKYEICNLDCYRTLVIHSVEPADEGLYTCDALDDRSTARLLVEAEGIQVVRALRNVDVVAPAEARFECEISAPPACSPQWSLNGEDLQPSSQVHMESMGHIHRLRLCQTTPGMSGMVKVTIGNARSKAHLTVRER